MGLYYQVFTGGVAGRGITVDDILCKLEGIPVHAVIIGWSEDTVMYRQLREALHHRGATMWLWFPVFSEHTMREGLFPQIGIHKGDPLGARKFDEDETFDFCCPSQKGLAQCLLDIFDRDFAEGGFDGVFLDRIRYPSMTAGAEALFGCTCEVCRNWLTEKGMPQQRLENMYLRLKMRMSDRDCADPLGLRQYHMGRFTFDDPEMEKLLRLKCDRIESVVHALCIGFRDRGLKIGMDLFAPFLAPLLGQDYAHLGAMADFIKPMLYRHTYTPAGFAFEIDAIARALSKDAPDAYEKRRAYLRRQIGIDNDTGSFFDRELMAIPAVTHIAPGIELHTAEEQPPIQWADIADNVRRIEKAGFADRVACWNILSAEREALAVFAGDIGRNQI